MEIKMEITFDTLCEQDLTITTQDVLERIANVDKEDEFMDYLESLFLGEGIPTVDEIDDYIYDYEEDVLARFGLGEYDFIVNVKGIEDALEFNWRDGDLAIKLPDSPDYEEAQWDVESVEVAEAIIKTCEEYAFKCTRIYNCDTGEYIYESEEEDEE